MDSPLCRTSKRIGLIHSAVSPDTLYECYGVLTSYPEVFSTQSWWNSRVRSRICRSSLHLYSMDTQHRPRRMLSSGMMKRPWFVL